MAAERTGLLLILLLSATAARAEAAGPPSVSYDGKGLRDPFNPPSAKTVAKSEVKEEITNMSFTLEGLVWESDRPQAIVNGQIVQKGADVSGAEVLAIDKNGVRMRYKGQEFILRPRGKTP